MEALAGSTSQNCKSFNVLFSEAYAVFRLRKKRWIIGGALAVGVVALLLIPSVQRRIARALPWSAQLLVVPVIGPAYNGDAVLYGKAVDQDGRPVAGADFTFSCQAYERGGSVSLDHGPPTQEFQVSTGADGSFVVRRQGTWLLLKYVRRAGYVFDKELGERQWRFEVDPATPPAGSPADPKLFRAWRIIGRPETLWDIGYSYSGGVNPGKENTAYSVFLFHSPTYVPYFKEGKEPDADVWMTFSLVRDEPRNPKWVSKVRYHVTLPHGGIVPTNEPYPYMAPEEGYKNEVDLEFPVVHNGIPPKHWFYFKSEDGKVYARIDIPGFKGWANLNGSRDLQPGGGFLNH